MNAGAEPLSLAWEREMFRQAWAKAANARLPVSVQAPSHHISPAAVTPFPVSVPPAPLSAADAGRTVAEPLDCPCGCGLPVTAEGTAGRPKVYANGAACRMRAKRSRDRSAR